MISDKRKLFIYVYVPTELHNYKVHGIMESMREEATAEQIGRYRVMLEEMK